MPNDDTRTVAIDGSAGFAGVQFLPGEGIRPQRARRPRASI